MEELWSLDAEIKDKTKSYRASFRGSKRKTSTVTESDCNLPKWICPETASVNKHHNHFHLEKHEKKKSHPSTDMRYLVVRI